MSKPVALPPTFSLDSISDSVERRSVEIILTDLNSAHAKIQKAARKWVTLSEETRDQVIAATPSGMRAIWEKLEAVGNGELHPRLVTADGIAARYLSRLPLKEQEKHLDELIEVAVIHNRSPDVMRIDVEAMSSFQRQQVFDVKGSSVRIRTIAEQRAWLAEQKRKEQAREERAETTRIDRPGRWKVENGRVYVAPEKIESGLTKRDVAGMLRDLNL